MVTPHTPRKHWARLCGSLLVLLLLAACSGPDEFRDDPPPPTPTTAPSPTEASESEPSPTEEVVPTPTTEDVADVTPTSDATAEPTAEETPEAEPTPTEEVEPTPTAEPISAMEALPRLEELTDGGYVVADQGDRNAEQLAGAYNDSAAHLARLEQWGFRQHVFREFTRNETGPDDPLPTYVLATVNVYGSVEQADLALQWVADYHVNQGATIVDAPDVGDAAVALTVPTSQGEPTASIYVRSGDRMYAFYAQDNDPLAEVTAIAQRVFERLQNAGQTALLR